MNQLRFRPVKHLKMTVWTSVLWKMNIQMAKKWPEMVVTRSIIKEHSFWITLYLLTAKLSTGIMQFLESAIHLYSCMCTYFLKGLNFPTLTALVLTGAVCFIHRKVISTMWQTIALLYPQLLENSQWKNDFEVDFLIFFL